MKEIITVSHSIPYDSIIDIIRNRDDIYVSDFFIDKLNNSISNSQSIEWLRDIVEKDKIKNTAEFNLKLGKLLANIFGSYDDIPSYYYADIANGMLVIDVDKQEFLQRFSLGDDQDCFRIYSCPKNKSHRSILSKKLDEDIYTKYGRMIFEHAHYSTVLDRIIDDSINIISKDIVLKYYEDYKKIWSDQDIFQYQFNSRYNNVSSNGAYSQNLSVSIYRNIQSIEVYYDNENDLSCYLSDGWIIDDDSYLVYKSENISAHDAFERFYKNDIKNIESEGATMLPFTMQITDECNLRCTYCYQINKGHRKMTKETAKKVIDFLLNIDEDNTAYLDIANLPGITIEFVGGDGLLDIELVEYTLNYFIETAVNMNHKWANMWQSYISTNGVLYRSEKVQNLISRWNNVALSIVVTVDGNKELHDKCRVFPDGSGSYDLAIDANLDILRRGLSPSSKITLSPDNIKYFSDSIIDYIEKGFIHIWFNGIFEHEWTAEEATSFYFQLKYIIDYIFESGLENRIDLMPLKETYFKPKTIEDNINYCGGNGRMLMVDPDGVFHNCTRYSSSSLGNERSALTIGDCFSGIGVTSEQKNNISLMKNVTRRSQSTDECFYCPIAAGCSWCSAYNYQRFGTPNKRTTTTCNLHKAEALATAYYWKKYYKSNNLDISYIMSFEYEFVKNIISKEEYDLLINM